MITMLYDPLMSRVGLASSSNRLEAERLIGLARAMLSTPGEQMAVHYLDHAIAALHDLPNPEAVAHNVTSPTAPTPDPD
jgi:hypothetical protein